MKKVLFILFLPYLVTLFIGCCDCAEDASSPFYTHCTMRVSNLDNAGATPQVSDDNQIKKEAFGLRVQVDRYENICNQKLSPFLFSAAYAYDCFCDYDTQNLTDTLTTLTVITKNDLDLDHPAGSDVTDYFYLFENNEYKSISGNLVESYSSQYRHYTPTLEMDLLLLTPPAIEGEHQFNIKLELSDGRTFELDSEKVKLK